MVGFGHFCEVRKVKEGPRDVIVSPGKSEYMFTDAGYMRDDD